MRHSLIMLAAAAVVAGVGLCAGSANAAPLPKLDTVTNQAAPVEAVRYYRRWGYRPYGYWRRPYYAPRRYYGYPYYRPYYRGYGYRYGYRPYYGHRYWR